MADNRRFSPLIPLVVAVLGLAAITVAQAAPNRHAMEEDLTGRSEQELRAAGLSDVEVSFTGRDGSLKVGSAADAERALAIVRAVQGVRVADATVPPVATPSPAAAPPKVNLAVDAGRVVITGTVPTEMARAALVDAVTAVFGAGAVDDKLTIDAAVTDAGLSGLTGVVTALGKDAKAATVDLHDGTLTLTGTVSSAASKDAVVAAAAGVVGQTAVVDRLQVAEVQQQLINLPPVTFLDNSATLTPAGQAALVKAAAILVANPTVRIRIEGHTDANGSAESNLALSQARAQTVLTVLQSLGVAKDRMTAQGFGETRLRVPDTSDANRAINRRVEFIVER